MPTALNDLLQVPSRSFYLTLRVRPQIGLAALGGAQSENGDGETKPD
jgi:hypothetical protein